MSVSITLKSVEVNPASVTLTVQLQATGLPSALKTYTYSRTSDLDLPTIKAEQLLEAQRINRLVNMSGNIKNNIGKDLVKIATGSNDPVVQALVNDVILNYDALTLIVSIQAGGTAQIKTYDFNDLQGMNAQSIAQAVLPDALAAKALVTQANTLQAQVNSVLGSA